jgi:hypothetical protein
MQVNLVGAEEDSDRRMGVFGAFKSNMLKMIGVGPILSIPLVLVAMHGSKCKRRSIKRSAGEKFIEEPGAPVGCASHKCGDGILRDGFE